MGRPVYMKVIYFRTFCGSGGGVELVCLKNQPSGAIGELSLPFSVWGHKHLLTFAKHAR
jgi:hypothetical protein